MVKAMKALFAIFFVILIVSGALAAEKKNKPDIKTVDNYIAVFDFEVRTKDKDISRSLADRVIHEFTMSDRYKVIDRGNMNKILKEQKFQMSGCVAQECKVEAGQLLGVGKIVSGSVGIVGKTYYLTLQLIDVRTGEILKSTEDKCKCEVDELLDSTKRLAKKLLSEQDEQPVTTAPKSEIVIESEAEALAKDQATAKAKVEADKIAKAKAEAEEIERAKAEAEEIAEAKADAIAKAEEIERVKAEQIAKAKAEETARAKNEADELARQKAALELDKQEMARERQEMERQQLAMAKRPSQPTTGETARDGRFIAYNNGTVLDTMTNLTWAGNDNGSDINWANAKRYCQHFRGGDYTDWRMPTQDELARLYDAAKTYKSYSGYDVHLTELIRLTSTATWASETRGYEAASFYFYSGVLNWVHQSNVTYYRALPVRSGK